MEKYLNFGYLDLNKNMGTLNRLSNLFEILQKIKNASSVRIHTGRTRMWFVIYYSICEWDVKLSYLVYLGLFGHIIK